jgi:hypothetical protein
MSFISDAIILQLCGSKEKLIQLTQAHSFSLYENGLKFEFKAPSKNNANVIDILLEKNDTYSIKFYNKKKFKNAKIVSEFNNVLFFELLFLFERETGMSLN